jgi:lipopolysaccharide assembly outer membrane protein LptD (OstA)
MAIGPSRTFMWTLLLAAAGARAADSTCPEPAPTALANPGDTEAAPTDDRIHIEAESGEVNLKGTSVLSGDVVLRQGSRRVRADHLEYDAVTERF